MTRYPWWIYVVNFLFGPTCTVMILTWRERRAWWRRRRAMLRAWHKAQPKDFSGPS